MSIRKLSNGRYQCSYEDKFRGIKRTRRIFETRKEAEEWQAYLKTEGHNHLLGRARRRIFGEALTEFLTNHSPAKKTHQEDISNASLLRIPFKYNGKFVWLEDLPLEGSKTELTIVRGLAHWIADQKKISKQVVRDNTRYQLRECWYRQDCEIGRKPPPRARVKDADLIKELNQAKGRGPYQSATLRKKQALVSVIVGLAWSHWEWINQDVARKIKFEPTGDPREIVINQDQLRDLAIHLPMGLDLAAVAGCWIGWRRSNILTLKWADVFFPIEHRQANGRITVTPGYITAQRQSVKTKTPLAFPMTSKIEGLFRMLWNDRCGEYVFHDGKGKPFRDFRRIFKTAKRKAGIDPRFTWHGLRHTWTTNMILSGHSNRVTQELGGWSNDKMIKNYSHMRIASLLEVLNDRDQGR